MFEKSKLKTGRDIYKKSELSSWKSYENLLLLPSPNISTESKILSYYDRTKLSISKVSLAKYGEQSFYMILSNFDHLPRSWEIITKFEFNVIDIIPANEYNNSSLFFALILWKETFLKSFLVFLKTWSYKVLNLSCH